MKAKAIETVAGNDTNNTDNISSLVSEIDDPTSVFLKLDEPVEGMEAEASAPAVAADDVIDYASKFLGRPYRRGSGGPSSLPIKFR